MEYMGDSGDSRPAGEAQDTSRRERADYEQQGQHGHQQTNPQQANHPYQHQQPVQNRADPYSMDSLSGALPNYPQDYSAAGGQRYPPNASQSAMQYQLQNIPQYGALPPHSGANSPYNFAYSQFPGQYQQIAQQNLQAQAGVNTTGQFYNNQAFVGQNHQQGQQFFVQPNQYIPQSPVFSNMPAAGQFMGRGGYPIDPRIQVQQRGNELLGSAQGLRGQGRSSSVASSTGRSSVVRGPPRKPRQSGHAIWIGNLPPQTDLMSLVLHVCKETTGLESLFLISKSNCAFANFKDEESCAAAQSKIHDSRFQTVGLVSRLRKSSVGTLTGVSAPTGPAALVPQPAPVVRTPSPEDDANVKETATETVTSEPAEDSTPPKDKFFVVKSLTVEDLELSVRNGIWATQSHNEEALNQAYETADNVYLIFSANKSGEYFGYARMVSPINDDPAAAIEFAPKAQAAEDPELPKAIPTPATEFAPKGRIIDDSARGTIFWEVERDESEEAEVEDEEQSSNRSDGDESTTASKAWGKPFKIEWVSTTRLPFYRTRGLRNPWNSNREVKIARDGTELETGVGRRLVGLFHRLPSPVVPQQSQGVPLMMAGYPQVRPY